MDLFTRDDLKTLLAELPSPCVSLFMPAHRGGAEEDPIRWRKHLAEVEDRLGQAGRRAAEVKELRAPARRLLDDGEFWKHQSDVGTLKNREAATEHRRRLGQRDEVPGGGVLERHGTDQTEDWAPSRSNGPAHHG